VALLVFVGFSFALLEYTHQPRFCISCHIMQPYYNAWQTSSHNKVSCVECHYPPGLRYEFRGKLDALNQVVAYWTGKYNTKFYAEIEDVSCMRSGCHTERLVSGPIEFKRQIKFDHAGHYGKKVRGIELRCTSCHSQIVQGNHMAVTEFTCFLCHFYKNLGPDKIVPMKFCLQCHNYPQSYINAHGVQYNHKDFVERGVICWRCHSDVVRGNGAVEDRACLQCHSDPEQLNKIGEVEQVHLNHVTRHKVECFDCHSNIEHSLPASSGPPQINCTACHQDTHLGPPQLYSGTGGRGVPDMPSAMFRAQVDCIGCHLSKNTYGKEHILKGTTMKPTVDACADCHGESARKIFSFWQQSLEQNMAATSPVLEGANAVLSKFPADRLPAEAKQLLEDAQFNYDFVKYGKGIHNLNYSLALLEKAREDAKQAVAIVRGGGAK